MPRLTTKQRVHALVAEGLNNREISDKIGLCIETVRYHKSPERQKRQDGYISEQRRLLKKKAVDYSGGSCLKCGYNACMQALTFHHLDPEVKEFGLTSFRLWNWKKVIEEIRKTLLLCNRCHTEVHHGVWKPDEEMIWRQAVLRHETREGVEPSQSVLQTDFLPRETGRKRAGDGA